MDALDVTVVICTYNRADMLRIALKSLIAQETQGAFSYEVVVVDDRSTDNTGGVVAELAAGAAMPVRCVRADGQGVAHARNCGIKAARGAWVAFTDDDQWNEPAWLYQLVMAARASGVDCVGGAVVLDLPADASLPLTPLTQSILGRKATAEGHVPRLMDMPGTGNVMFKRSVFDTVGLFEEALEWGGEDAEYMMRAVRKGVRVWFASRSVVHHMIPRYRLSEKYFRWISLRVGVALAEVDARIRGRRALLMLCAARVAQAALIHAPRLLLAVIARDAARVLEKKCLLWRMTSYARQALHLFAPRLFPQEAFFTSLKFRVERTTVATESPQKQG